jgi:hypothetical protein
MKFYVRRAVVGLVAVPLVAGAYLLGYALLVGAGAGASSNASEVWATGLWIGGLSAVFLTFAPQVINLARKVSA